MDTAGVRAVPYVLCACKELDRPCGLHVKAARNASPLPPSVPLGLAAQLASQALGPELRSKLQGPPSHPAHLRYLTALPWEPPPPKHWPPN